MFGFQAFGRRVMQMGMKNVSVKNNYSQSRAIAWSNMQTTTLMMRASPVPNLGLMNIMNLRELIERCVEESQLETHGSIAVSDILVSGLLQQSGMTLEIKIAKITSIIQSPDLYISGSQTGKYKILSSFGTQDERRITYFAQNQCMEISLYERNKNPDTQSSRAFINYPCELIKQLVLKKSQQNNQPTPCKSIVKKDDVKLYNQRDQPIATVHMLVVYERGLLFRGGLFQGPEKKTIGRSFYKGSDPQGVTNIFNFLDSCCCSVMVDEQFKGIESVYSDKYQ